MRAVLRAVNGFCRAIPFFAVLCASLRIQRLHIGQGSRCHDVCVIKQRVISFGEGRRQRVLLGGQALHPIKGFCSDDHGLHFGSWRTKLPHADQCNFIKHLCTDERASLREGLRLIRFAAVA